jgi:hypothetical protein
VYTSVSGITTTPGGAGKIIGGGRGMLTCTPTPASAETGMKTINIKNAFKINFFIAVPPLFSNHSDVYNSRD